MKSALLTCQTNQPRKGTEENVPDQRRDQGFANVQSSCWWQEKRTRSSRGFLICNGHSVVLRTQSWQDNFFNRLQSTTLQSSLLEP
ncbi:uncharacterized protein LOC129268711 isoform X4 [Lytechinus pictus]|uniref:uncharacterized protein LOC129268711 isoform X4 n=1 Tax=Lytechinus pictus TaxID=7653 RepID=UPI0030B9BAE6